MKHLIKLVFFVTLTNYSLAQNTDFLHKTNSPFINEIDIKIDSLQNILNQYDFDKNEILNNTATAYYIFMDKGDIQSAMIDIENKISFEEWAFKYKYAKIYEDLIVVKTDYDNYRDKPMTNYSNLPTKKLLPRSILTSIDKDYKAGDWIINYSPKNKAVDEFLIGFYLTSGFGDVNLEKQFPKVIAFGNAIEERSNNWLNNSNKTPVFDKILHFLEKLIDVCAAIVINYNNPDIIRYAVANVVVPKMTKQNISR
ncbi:MAG: hypothetical protein AB7O47_02965 [Flavobacteriales bacterium]